MAEVVVSAFLQAIFENLTSVAIKKLSRSKGIHEPLKEWERLLSQIRAVLSDAAQKEINDESVKRWLNGLQHLAYDIDDVLDDLATKAMHRELNKESGANTSKVRKLVPTCCTNFSLETRMDDRLSNITTKLQSLAEEKNTLGLIVKSGKSKNMNRRLETSLVDVSGIVGRQADKEVLLKKLLGDEECSQNFSIVPIVGMGGIGKTTLAKLLYNDTQVEDHFKLKAWVTVSDEFDIFKISNIIFHAVTNEDKKFADLNLLQVALREKLSEKRFLLVLDDVWSESRRDWELLARPFGVGEHGSKIIVTTRNESVASMMGSAEHYHLGILSDDSAISLFAQHALSKNNFDSHPTLKSYGEGIVKKCGGLPLALIALGTLLWTIKNEEEWEEVLNSEIWRLPEEREIIPALRLSYHNLPAHLKQLFAYCSLFPKDYVFDKDELVLLWMAEGFLDRSSGNNSMERYGRECFEKLLPRSFFQQHSNGKSYVMHDLMNDLAAFVAGDFVFRFDDKMDANVKHNDLEKYRHMSFISQEYGVYKKFKIFHKAKSLRTLLPVSVGVERGWGRFYLSNKVLFELLPQLPLLRVLHLSNYLISVVPESIGSLKHLRYLNLSRTRITRLPEQVGSLYHLQTLLLRGCDELRHLPSSFLKLKSLRHLDISGTPLLEKMPLGIGKLKSLQTLSKVVIEGANGFSITELKSLEHLSGVLSIKGLDKVQNPTEARESNLLQKRLCDFEMEWNDVFYGSRNETFENEVLSALKPCNDNLEKLGIVSYGGVEFPGWVGDPSFRRLAHVTIRGCKNCTSLPALGHLPLLKQLVVQGMDGVVVVGSEFLGNGNYCGGAAFPSLETLHFKNMLMWEVWSTNNGNVGNNFPCLQELYIHDCPKLIEASLSSLPSLRILEISGCRDVVLTSMAQVASSVTELEIKAVVGLTWLHGGVIENLVAVEELRIVGCHEMRYLWESEVDVCKSLSNLRKLEVGSCKKLVSFGKRDEDNCGSSLTSLRDIEIWSCESLEHYTCPKSIESLDIRDCPSITTVSFPTRELKLKLLWISRCEKLSYGGGELSRMFLDHNMSSLEEIFIADVSNLKLFPDLSCYVRLNSLSIHNCDNLESFPCQQLPTLTSLWIEDCKNLESFPCQQLPTLTSLTSMRISDCPCMDDSFPGGLWPPKLSELKIGRLKKPISKWGPQNFPTSLVYMTLVGGSSDDVNNRTQLCDLLPQSLTNLCISDFEKLGSISKGLQHLTSLQHLWIVKCQNLRDLPETNLLDSLLSLGISECPKLKKKCSKIGSYWPRISHIPSIDIY